MGARGLQKALPGHGVLQLVITERIRLPQQGRCRPADIGGHRVDRAVGEVDDVGCTEDQAEADPKQGIMAAVDDPVDQQLEEQVHGRRHSERMGCSRSMRS